MKTYKTTITSPNQLEQVLNRMASEGFTDVEFSVIAEMILVVGKREQSHIEFVEKTMAQLEKAK